MDEIARDASVRAGKDPSGAVLSYEDAAKRVEARWSEFRALISAPQDPPPPQSTTAATKPALTAAPTKTSSNGKPAVPPAPLTKKPPATYDELLNAAIAEGVAEYKRVESEYRKSASAQQ